MKNSNFIRRDECPLCGSKNLYMFVSVPFDDPVRFSYLKTRYPETTPEDYRGVTYDIRRCSDCSGYHQTYIPTDEFAVKVYRGERGADQLEKKISDDIGRFEKNAQEVKKIAYLLNKNPGQIHVLEFGSGWGFWSRMAQAYGYKITAVETSEERLAFARKHSITSASSLETLGNTQFDYIYSDQVLEHVANPRDVMKKIAELLAPNGILRIAVPDAESITQEEILKKTPLKIVQPLEHINGFTHTSLVSMMREQNLVPMPPFVIARKLLGAVTFTRNLDMLQEAVRGYVNQQRGTTLYFIKKGR